MQPPLIPADFGTFFKSLHGYTPFQWQQRLAEEVCAGNWRDFIKLPTSSGKTACLDIAVFALACQAAKYHDAPDRIVAPRRIFFVVDRRIIVNEAIQRAEHICDQLEKALGDQSSELHPVAYWLKSLTHHEHAPPLDCFELRGGIYRDDAWVRSMLQPTILTSTVDQFGSRVLFRGYGVTDRNLPIHAALTANDALVILDEAHCSQPFSQTIDAVARYRDAGLASDETAKWSESPIRTPFAFTQMTATPDSAATPESIFELLPTDYEADGKLHRRHACNKPVRLVESNAKGKRLNELLAKTLVAAAESLANPGDEQTPCRRIAIVVNRVACARAAYHLLVDKYPDQVHLMIGRMRPYDRDLLTETLQDTFRSDPDRNDHDQPDEPQFVVATQCLEVGADFDFDGMVSQCASLDALRQRFGRLNRLGLSDYARGAIVMAAGDVKPKDDDPIYGTALPATWNRLQERANDGEAVDFGILAMDALLSQSGVDVPSLAPQSVNAPVFLPAHLDLLCQTSPRPAVGPEIAHFLHGPDRGQKEVRVCWRADLPEMAGPLNDRTKWAAAACEAVAICPPTSAEVMAVPLSLFRRWLNGEDSHDNSGDILGEVRDSSNDAKPGEAPLNRRGIIWKGKSERSAFLSGSTRNEIRPNDTIVLPVTAGGWSEFGHIPDAPDEPDPSVELGTAQARALAGIDIGDVAFKQARNRTILRLHPSLVRSPSDARCIAPITTHLQLTVRDVLYPEDRGDALDGDAEPADEMNGFGMEQRREELRTFCPKDKNSTCQIQQLRYTGGLVLIGPREESANQSRRKLPRASFGDDFDEANVDAAKRILLADHLADVAKETERMLTAIPPHADVAAAVIEAARLHDLGKADPRFQAMLLQTTPDVACMQPRLLAKSAGGSSPQQATGQKTSKSLPRGFRHEMLSVDLATRVTNDLSDQQRDLMLHTIAAHHGYARPFAPVVVDDNPPNVSLKKLDGVSDVSMSSEERIKSIPHRLGSGIAERFWRFNKRFGWWGLAWLETAVRLSDWTASEIPVVSKAELRLVSRKTESKLTERHELPCPGIDGSNPLGFLSALGLLRTATQIFPDCRMAWRRSGAWIPVLLLPDPMSESDFIHAVEAHLRGRSAAPHFTDLGQNTTVPQVEFRRRLFAALEMADLHSRTTVDYYAAFGTDGLVSENDGTTIQDTALRTMAGAGHQHFLETMRNVIDACSVKHLQKTLFETWRYDDPTQTLSLRFDPLDDNRYALRWRNPSGDPDRKKSGSMLGANRLAIEALPFFTTAPGLRFIETIGFRGHRSRDTFFHWPIWVKPICADVVASLLASPTVFRENKDVHQAFGIGNIFTSQRITVGKVRNFTPARAVSGETIS